MLRDDNHEHEHNERNERNEHDEHDEHQRNDEHQACKEQQPDPLTPPRKDALPIDFGNPVKDPYMPGLVEVEFIDGTFSGVFDEDFDDATERRKPSKDWDDKLKQYVLQNQMVSWKPSFPLTYSWSRMSRDEAREPYKLQGRDRFVTFKFSEKVNVAEVAAVLKNAPKVVRARPVARLRPSEITEPLLGSSEDPQPFASGLENQWYAFRCNLTDAFAQGVTGNNVVIAAIDWGFDRSHQDYSIEFRRNIYHQSEGVGCGNAIHHGTAVLGLAGARFNSFGMVGFAPNSTLWAIQAGEDAVMHPDYWREAIDFVREKASPYPKVIILEAQTAKRGNIEGIPSINLAIANAVTAGVVVVVPAGNAAGDAGRDDEGELIPETGSIVVGATTVDNVPIGKGGERIAVYAPGDPAHDVTCTSLPERHTNFFGGTSGAAAKVAGAVALLLEANSALRPADVKELIKLSPTSVVAQTTAKGEPETVGVLLDCKYAVASCTARMQPERVLTNSRAMV